MQRIIHFRKTLLIIRLCLTCCLLILSLNALGQGFGKLFTTPEERQYLDSLREKFLQRTELQGFNINEQLRPLLTEGTDNQSAEFELSGFMKRQGGGKSVWLNGESVSEGDLPQNIRVVNRRGTDMLRIETSERVHYIKAGQTLNIETGAVRESFEPKPEKAASGLASSITGLFQNDDKEEEPKSPASSSSKNSVGIDDLIQALQTIQETKGE